MDSVLGQIMSPAFDALADQIQTDVTSAVPVGLAVAIVSVGVFISFRVFNALVASGEGTKLHKGPGARDPWERYEKQKAKQTRKELARDRAEGHGFDRRDPFARGTVAQREKNWRDEEYFRDFVSTSGRDAGPSIDLTSRAREARDSESSGVGWVTVNQANVDPGFEWDDEFSGETVWDDDLNDFVYRDPRNDVLG